MRLKETPSQTAGPYVHIGCSPHVAGLEKRALGQPLGLEMVDEAEDIIALTIKVLDGASEVVKDAMIEIWQADPQGDFAPTSAFKNWGRQSTDLHDGTARFKTCKPGPQGDQVPHVLVWIVARGINLGLTTRIYFPDENNSADPIFALAGARATTMVAAKVEGGYAHTIRLQGPDETVFFDV